MPANAAPHAAPALAECQEVLGHAFRDAGLLALALTHASARPTGLPSSSRAVERVSLGSTTTRSAWRPFAPCMDVSVTCGFGNSP